MMKALAVNKSNFARIFMMKAPLCMRFFEKRSSFNHRFSESIRQSPIQHLLHEEEEAGRKRLEQLGGEEFSAGDSAKLRNIKKSS
jgi:hypothetical protein